MEKLRFKQEDGTDYPEWEETALGEMVVKPASAPLPGRFIYVDLESVKGGRLVSRNWVDKSDAPSRAQRVIKSDDVLFQTVRPYQANNFMVGEELDGMVASSAYALLRAEEGVSPSFVYQVVSSQHFISKVLAMCVGGMYPAISGTDLLRIVTIRPSLPEQERIATFLGLLDERIEAQRVLVDGLEQEKRGYMQAMLSPTPTLRFKQEDGTDYPDWEYRRLDSITSFRMGFTPSTGDSSLWDGDHEWLSIAGLGDKKYVDSGNKRISDRAVSGKVPFPEGTLIMSFKLSIGKLGITRSAIYTNEAICGFENLDTFSTEYLYYALANTDVKSFGSRAVKGITLNSESLGGISLPFPSIPEQERIATFLGLLDHRLEVEKDILSNMEQEKRGFAQRLFL